MKELICPNCGKPFQVDDADYAKLLGQVKNNEFQAELKTRIEELHAQWESEHQVAELKEAQKHQQALEAKTRELDAKDARILQLQTQLQGINQAKQAELDLALSEQKSQFTQRISDQELKIAELRNKQESLQSEAKLTEQNLISKYEEKLNEAKEQIEHYRTMKSVMSTKMLGETLEIHCSQLYDQRIRPYLPEATFGKDNDASGGSKGDFIFRDRIDSNEYISIMFEMKNEMEQTEKKHKNSDFFDKLDRDRKAKNCKYAVLVSTLEADNDLYNEGIVNVSHMHENMFVVRPQFFVTIIQQLRGIAQAAYGYEQQLAVERNKTVDVSNFEKKLVDFKDKFGRNVRLASDRFNDAIKEIDATIKHLQEVKANLTGSKTYLERANGNTEDLTIRKLTYNNPTMKELFEQAAQAADPNSAEPDTENDETLDQTVNG